MLCMWWEALTPVHWELLTPNLHCGLFCGDMSTWYKGVSEGTFIDEEPSLHPKVQLAVRTGYSAQGTCSAHVALLW